MSQKLQFLSLYQDTTTIDYIKPLTPYAYKFIAMQLKEKAK